MSPSLPRPAWCFVCTVILFDYFQKHTNAYPAVGHLGRAPRSGRGPHTLENKPQRIYLLIPLLPHTQEILGRSSFLALRGAHCPGEPALPIVTGNVWVVEKSSVTPLRAWRKRKFRVLGSSPHSATSFTVSLGPVRPPPPGHL